jgi:hypothetical protein
MPETRLDALLRRQQGLATRAQLIACGVTDGAVTAHLRGRRWQRLAPGLYASFTGGLTVDQRLLAACLHVGPGAQVTGGAALRWHGLRYLPAVDEAAVLARHPCKTRGVAGLVRVVQTGRLDRREWRCGGITVVSPARAVADEARWMRSMRAVRALVAEAVQRNLVTVPQLTAEVEGGRRNGSALLRRAVEEVAAGTRSAPETELRELVARSAALPSIAWNPWLRLPDGTTLSPDGWIAESAVALEVDSREYHLSPAGWERTMRRHNAFAAAGATTLHISPARLRRDPSEVLQTIERAHAARRGRGRKCSLAVIMSPKSA